MKRPERVSRDRPLHRINKSIRVTPIRVIMDGDQLGVMETRKALALAMENGLDLVEVSANTRPPICKILDYGKFKYDEAKKAKEKRANQTRVETKEMKFRPKTDVHDMDFKCKHVEKFITEGNRCKLVVFFKGRERAHPRVGNDLLMGVATRLEAIAEITQRPTMEGNRMTMMLGPRSSVPAKEASSGQEG